MSADEDTELRDLVAQTLEANGTLGKLRAQLRASVFLALEEQENVQNRTPFLNKELKTFLSTKDGHLVASLVREFLEFFHLEFTLAVFDPETGLEDALNRENLSKELNLRNHPREGESHVPLLVEVLKGANTHTSKQQLQHSTVSPIGGSSSIAERDFNSLPKNLSEKQLLDAREKFDLYDRDGSGAIDKDELRELFIDLFPGFNRNMLEKYVQDEFKAIDKDFSSSIEFDEFLAMYKRLFLQCRSVVSGEVDEIVSTGHKQKLAFSGALTKADILTSSVEVKNQRNLEKSGPPPLPTSAPPNSAKSSNLYEDLLGDDSFFDGPLPSSSVLTPYGSSEIDKGKKKGEEANSDGVRKAASESPFVTSGGLVSVQNNHSATGFISRPRESDASLRTLDRRMANLDMGGDAQDDYEYEDDFQSSGHSFSQRSPRSKGEGKTENGSVAEEIDDEEIEDGSIDAENSGFDDITTDRSISQMDGGFDYMEDAQLH
ncbi:FGFR1 oncogene partner-like isoform X2 [Pomacea canaliculata]|uniref:FGFR1 oncogene partner-like isoform X2 n=1 Tax=Pomacea canaliculata TaxID=400727 RepID=UPI000D731BA2|nr:FGFR1 oncogene partner-like isoform X2 [Pomacea canaliculata]